MPLLIWMSLWVASSSSLWMHRMIINPGGAQKEIFTHGQRRIRCRMAPVSVEQADARIRTAFASSDGPSGGRTRWARAILSRPRRRVAHLLAGMPRLGITGRGGGSDDARAGGRHWR